MRKNKIVVFLIILTLLFSFGLTGCSLNDYARITDMDYRAVVVDEPNSEGKIVVTERITFDVHAADPNNGFWELWRDLCESEIDGVKVHYKVNSVHQIMPDGSKVPWTESPQLYWDDYDYISSELGPGKWFHSPGPYNENRRQYECLLFYVDNLYREKITFEIEYEMYNAVLKYKDCSDLYISMYSGDTTKYLESFSAQILVPNKDMPRAGSYEYTTYGTNKNSFPVEESTIKNPGYHTFSINLDKDDLKFNTNNAYIEFDLVSYGIDKHSFAEHAPRNDYSDYDVLAEIFAEQAEYENAYKRTQSAKVLVFMICVVAAATIAIGGWKKVSDFKKKNPSFAFAEFKGTYRDIPNDLDPKFAAALVFCRDKKQKDDSGVYSAILLNLARKKYIELKEMSSKDILITLKEDEAIILPQNTSETEVSASTPSALDGYAQSSPSAEPWGYANSSNYGSTYSQPTLGTDPSGRKPFFSMFEPATPIRPQVAINMREPLTMSEEYYLNLIKHHSIDNCITMEILQRRITTDYDYTKTFSDNMKRVVVDIGVSQGYIANSDWQDSKNKMNSYGKGCIITGACVALSNLVFMLTPIGLAFGGMIIFAIISCITGLLLVANAHKYVVLTDFGEQEYKKWRGLYNFLKSDTLINEKTFIELPLWEKYLVYATAFDISEKVIAAIKIRCPEARTVEESKSIIHSTYSRSGRYRSSGRSFHTSVHHGAHRHTSYGGSYGGYSSGRSHGSFGYGGGGRGGGGGGGGH